MHEYEATEQAMQDDLLAEVLASGDFVTAERIGQADQVVAWQASGDIFSNMHDGARLYPRYALDLTLTPRPKRMIKKIIAALDMTWTV